MDDRLIKLGMSSDFSGFRKTGKKDDERSKKCSRVNKGKEIKEDL